MTEVVTLGELAVKGRLIFNDGYRTKQDELGEPGIPILRVAEVQDGIIEAAFGDHVREEHRAAIGAKTSRAGDVVVTTKGTVGRVARIREAMAEFVYSPQLCYFRATGNSGIDAGFLYYWFRGKEFQRQAAGVQNQTDMAAYINLADMGRITVTLPPVTEQRAIADILGALDDKIESNDRIAETMAKLVSSLFAFYCRSFGSATPLTQLADIAKGVSYRSVDLAASSAAMVTLKSVDRSGGYKSDGLKPYVGPYKPSQVLNTGDLVVAQTDLTQGAEVVGRAVRIPRVEGFKTLIASLDLLIVRPREGVPREYLHGVLMQESFREHCRRHTSGTTVLHLASDALARYEVPDVTSDSQREFALAVRPLLESSDVLGQQDSMLRALRDTLLPELLSGRLRLPEAREQIGAVG